MFGSMSRWRVFFLCAAAGFAQSPPSGLDDALRARVKEFYQDHVDGKFRQAEALVAEDSKDYYYNSNKTRYLSFEIQKIEYSDQNTRAKVTATCEQFIPLPEFAGKSFKLPVISLWKLVDDQWYWYVDPSLMSQTPFGKINITGGTPSPAQITIPKGEDVLRTLSSQIKADKDTVSLHAGDSAQVTITNGAPGGISIFLLGKAPGIDVKPDHAHIDAGQKAVLTLQASDSARSAAISILVEQTNQIIPIRIEIE